MKKVLNSIPDTGILIPVICMIMIAANCQRNDSSPTDEAFLLEGKRVAILITEGFHDQETLFPLGFFINHGAEVTVIGDERGEYTSSNGRVNAMVEKSVIEVSPQDFDALVIPGGRSPGNLIEDDRVLSFTREFVETGKPVGAICHGPLVLVEAGVTRGLRLTGTGGVEENIVDAGADFVDEEVVMDSNLITSRNPGDIPAFVNRIARALVD